MLATVKPLAYRPSTFAKLTGLSLSFVKLEIYRGNLKAVKKGLRAWVIPAAAADEYLSQSDTAKAAATVSRGAK